MSAVLAILLAMSPAIRVPDLWVEAHSETGAELPELAEAVARALIAGGARVVLGGSAGEPCPHCARVAVTELGEGRCRIEVNQDTHAATTFLRLGASNPLLDRARAIAIQTRLLVKREPVAKSRRAVASNRRPKPKSMEAPASEPEPDEAALGMTPLAELARPPTTPLPLTPPPVPELPAATPAEAPPAMPATTSPPPEPDVVETESAEPEGRADTASNDERRMVEKVVRPADAQPARRNVPGIETRAETAQSSGPRWPWIPLAVGVGAGVGAGLSAVVAKNRYDALAGDKSRPYDEALALKREGERWQTAAYLASGVAVVGIGIGIWGLLTGEPASPSVTPTVSPTAGGAVLSMTGGLP